MTQKEFIQIPVGNYKVQIGQNIYNLQKSKLSHGRHVITIYRFKNWEDSISIHESLNFNHPKVNYRLGIASPIKLDVYYHVFSCVSDRSCITDLSEFKLVPTSSYKQHLAKCKWLNFGEAINEFEITTDCNYGVRGNLVYKPSNYGVRNRI